MRGALPWGLLLLLACGTEPPPPGLTIEPLPPDGGVPPTVQAMIYGGGRGCRDDLDCESNACFFGTCSGITTVDELWRLERVGERVRARIALQPELFDRIAGLLADGATREEMGLAFRGRAVRALGALLEPGPDAPDRARRVRVVIEHLKRLLVTSPSAVAEVAAITLAWLGDGHGIDIVVVLTESERAASAIEALRALGRIRGEAGDIDTALITLLSTVSVDLGLELQRAGIEALGELGDPRAIGPLAAHLTTGPEPLANTVVESLNALTGQRLGVDALAWDRWISEHPPPEPPAYTPRGHDSMEDINLPTP